MSVPLWPVSLACLPPTGTGSCHQSSGGRGALREEKKPAFLFWSFISGSVQGKAGWDRGQPDLVDGNLAHSRGLELDDL